MFKKSFYVSILVCLGIFVAYKCFFTKKVEKENLLIIGTNSGFPPYEVIDEKGEIVGFDIDVANAIAKEMGKELVVKDMAFDALVLGLQQEKIDLILAGMSITKSRKKQIAMVHYHGKGLNSFPLVFWKKIPDGVESVYDLKKLDNKVVCTQSGNIQEEFIKQFDFLEIKSLEAISDLIMDIKYGKSIACVLEPFVVDEMKIKFPEIKVLDIPLKGKEQDFGNGIGIKKDNKKLIAQISEIVSKFKQDGTLSSLVNKWFKSFDTICKANYSG